MFKKAVIVFSDRKMRQTILKTEGMQNQNQVQLVRDQDHSIANSGSRSLEFGNNT